MTQKEIIELIKLISKSDLSEVKIKDGEFKISIRTKDFYAGKTYITESPAQNAGYQQMPPSAASVLGSPQPPITESAPPLQEKDDAPAENANLVAVKSPIVGTFYRSSSPDKPPFVKVGDTITAGSVVCIVEAMKLFNEIESEIRGKIVKVMVEDASPVEYDQVLFMVDPS